MVGFNGIVISSTASGCVSRRKTHQEKNFPGHNTGERRPLYGLFLLSLGWIIFLAEGKVSLFDSRSGVRGDSGHSAGPDSSWPEGPRVGEVLRRFEIVETASIPTGSVSIASQSARK